MQRGLRAGRAGPDPNASLRQYRRRAPLYDLELLAFEPARQQAIARLRAERGETVVDVGAGTGLSLPALARAVGPGGRVIAVEPCGDMMARARQRAGAAAWKHIEFVEAAAETARWRGGADAALFVFTHDVLASDRALANILGGLRPGARVVATGLQWAPAWAVPLNVFVWGAAMYSVTTMAALDRPWQRLAPWLDDFSVTSDFGGTIYLAAGTVRSR